MIGNSRFDRVKVDREHVRKERRADGPVRRVEQTADRRRQTVDRTKAGVRESHPAPEAGKRHIAASVRIVPIANRAFERRGGPPDPFLAEAIGHGRGAAGDVRLDQLSEGVETGAGRDRRRQVRGERRVHDGDPRHEEWTAQADLHAMGPRREHRVARDFAAGSGGRRNGDARKRWRSEALAPADHFEVLEDVAVVCGQARDGLGRVDGAPPADADDDLRPDAARERRAFGHHGRVGLAGDGKWRRGHARCLQVSDHAGRPFARPSAHDERAGTQPFDERRKAIHRAVAEDDSWGGGELKSDHIRPTTHRRPGTRSRT